MTEVMPTPRTLPLRLEEDVIQRLDRLAAIMAERAGGLEVSRTNAMRTALLRGIDVLETELGAPKTKPKKK